MPLQLTRYWFEFEKTEKSFVKRTYIGCRVTAFDYADAIAILSATISSRVKCISL